MITGVAVVEGDGLGVAVGDVVGSIDACTVAEGVGDCCGPPITGVKVFRNHSTRSVSVLGVIVYELVLSATFLPLYQIAVGLHPSFVSSRIKTCVFEGMDMFAHPSEIKFHQCAVTSRS